MEKMKLDIQRFNSTNKTTHYELSQYVANDKPTYLVDYNDDMVAIDTGIYEAKTQADLGVTNAGIAQTAAETAQTTANTAVTNAGTAQTTADGNATKIGDLANLATASKTNLVSAISEVKNEEVAGFNKFNLNNITTYDSTDMTASGVTITSGTITSAIDSSNSVFKLYGYVNLTATSSSASITINTTLRPENQYNISPIGFYMTTTGGNIRRCTAIVKTNGDIEFAFGTTGSGGGYLYIFPCLYFNSDFGDNE